MIFQLEILCKCLLLCGPRPSAAPDGRDELPATDVTQKEAHKSQAFISAANSMSGFRGGGKGGGGRRGGRLAPGQRPVSEGQRISIAEQLSQFQVRDSNK